MLVVHVFTYDGAVEVWLDTEAAEQDGLCLGCSPTRDEAIAQARASLVEAIAQLERMADRHAEVA
jgi:predicted Fe-S protein YdhL (DUF1289 family)